MTASLMTNKDIQSFFTDQKVMFSCYTTENKVIEAFGANLVKDDIFQGLLKNAAIGACNATTFASFKLMANMLLAQHGYTGTWHEVRHNGEVVYAFYQPSNVAVVEEASPTPEELWSNFSKVCPQWIVNNIESLGQDATVKLVQLAWTNRKVAKVEHEANVYVWVKRNIDSVAGYTPISFALAAMPLRVANSNVDLGVASATWGITPPKVMSISEKVADNSPDEQVKPVGNNTNVAPTIENVAELLVKCGIEGATVNAINAKHNDKGEISGYSIVYTTLDGRVKTTPYTTLVNRASQSDNAGQTA